MSDQGVLLLFSVGVILAALGIAAWLIVTGQTAYIDGLFLLLSCLVLVLAFGLYLRYLVRTAMQAAIAPAKPAKIAAIAQEKPGTSVRPRPVVAAPTALKGSAKTS